MTGTHSGHTSVRGNGGGVSLQKDDVTVAEVLKKAGYVTGLFGKWGLGEKGTDGVPNKKGFDEFFGYLHQLHAQFYYPEFFNASGLLKGLKGSLYEGGIRVPMIARWTNRIKSGTENKHINYFPDVLPTLAELGNATQFVPKNLDGISFLPTLLGETNQKEHEFLYWEDANYKRTAPFDMFSETMMQAVLAGKWKAVKNTLDSPIELYDLSKDIGEQNNIAPENLEIVEKMLRIMNKELKNAPPQLDITAKEAQDLYVPRVACANKN